MPENPYESAQHPHGESPGKRGRSLRLMVLLYGGIICIVVVFLLLPNVRTGREPARRNACLNNTKQILLALLAYESTHGELPPAYTVDAEGNRLHSWRALILPYIEQQSVYELIDFEKPWDDPANAEAREAAIQVYLCPSAPNEDEHLTTYMAVVGPDFAFAGHTPRKLDEVSDGVEYTIALVEVAHEHAVHWMDPRDADESLLLETEDGLRTGHGDVTIAGYLDGHVDPLDSDIDREALRQLLTIAGGEQVGE